MEVYEPIPTGQKVDTAELRAILQGASALPQLGERALEGLAAVLEVVHVPRGEKLVAQGVTGRFCYIVVHGRLRAMRRNRDGGERAVMELGRGEVVGLAHLLSDEGALADIYTVRDSALLTLSTAAFESMVQAHPEAVLAVARTAVATVRRGLEGMEKFTGELGTVAWVPYSEDAELARAGVSLVDAFRRAGGVALLTAAEVDRGLGAGATSTVGGDERVAAWLREREESQGCTLYQCDAAATPWTALALRQADRIIVATRAAERPDVDRLRSLVPPGERVVASDVDLLVVHDAATELPSGTDAWLDAAVFQRVYHVRAGRAADFDRVVRRLRHRAVGIVLGGGGARGIAHVGVLQAIAEAGIEIDVVGGASMGSIFAAAWARGWSPEQMMGKVRDVFAPKRALIDLTFPWVALVGGGKLGRVLRNLYEGLQIEDLWLPFFCTSTNLSAAGVEIHARGSLWESIRASVSLPGIFPPVHSGTSLLVDGGVLDNLPIDVMRQQCDGGPVIAVDVSSGDLPAVDPRYRHSISGWQLLRQRFMPFSRRIAVPSILDVISQSTVVGSRRSQERSLRLAALTLTPPVAAFHSLGFGDHEALYRAGYEYAVEQLKDWSPPAL